MTTQDLCLITHRSPPLAARFSVNLSRCLGPKPAFRSSKASWRRSDVVVRFGVGASWPPASPRRSGDRSKVVGDWQRHQSPQHLHLIYACVNFQLVNLVFATRARSISHVWPSAVGVGAGIIINLFLAHVHRRSHRRTVNPVKRIHLPSFPRAPVWSRVTRGGYDRLMLTGFWLRNRVGRKNRQAVDFENSPAIDVSARLFDRCARSGENRKK